MENKFNVSFTVELLQALHVAFPTEMEVPDFLGADYSVKEIVTWFILNRANNRAKDFMEPDGDSVTIKMIHGFSIDPMQCHLKQWPDLLVDFSPDDQSTHTKIYKAWRKMAKGISKPAAITFGYMAERGPVESDYSGAILNLSQPEISPKMAGFLLKDPGVPTHPAGLVDRGEVIWSPEELNKAEPPRTGDYVLRGSDIFRITNSGDEVEEVKTRTFHNSDIYGPLLNFLCALGTSVFPAVALDKLSRIKDCTYSLRVGGGRIYQLEVVVDDWKVTFDWDSEAVDWGHSNPPISLTVIDNLAQKIIIYQAGTIAALLEGM